MTAPAAAKKQSDARAPKTPVQAPPVQEEEQSSFIDVDINRLDTELVQLPKLVKRWGDKAAEARYNAAFLKSQLEITEARVELHIRENADSFTIAGKLTEAGVELRVKLHKDVEMATEAYLMAKLRADKLEATCNALREKRESINNAVILHGRQYFADTPTPQAREQAEQLQKSAVRKPLNR